MDTEVVEYTDPGCSWAWGSEPKLRLLRHRFGGRLRWRRVMGGLVEDMTELVRDFDPVDGADDYRRYWAKVAETTGMPYPARLRWMYTSTEPACRAVKSAQRQSEAIADGVLRRLREATFVFGEPPDTAERILATIRGIEGLDLERLGRDLAGDDTARALEADLRETRDPNDYVLNLDEGGPGKGNAKPTNGGWRYVFPTLIVRGPQGERTVPGWKPYEVYEEALEAVSPGVTDDPSPDPAPDEAFRIWPTLAPRELETVCGPEQKPPRGVVVHDWGAGVFYLTEQEAIAQGIDEGAPSR